MGPTPDPGFWRDLSVVVQGPAVADLESLFFSDWAFATGEKLTGPGPTAGRQAGRGPGTFTGHIARRYRHGPGRGQRPGRAR